MKKCRNENNFPRSKQPLRSLCDARCLTRMIRPAVIDTCKEMNPCPASAKCVNTEGGHKCSCPRGRRPKGDGSGGCEIDYSMPAIGMQSSFLFFFLPLGRHRHCFRWKFYGLKCKFLCMLIMYSHKLIDFLDMLHFIDRTNLHFQPK